MSPEQAADKLLKHIREGSELYLTLAKADKRWVFLRTALKLADKNKKSFIAQIALDALRVQIATRVSPQIIDLLNDYETPPPDPRRARK